MNRDYIFFEINSAEEVLIDPQYATKYSSTLDLEKIKEKFSDDDIIDIFQRIQLQENATISFNKDFITITIRDYLLEIIYIKIAENYNFINKLFASGKIKINYDIIKDAILDARKNIDFFNKLDNSMKLRIDLE